MPISMARALTALSLCMAAVLPAAPVAAAPLPTYRIDFLDLPTPDFRATAALELNERGEALVLRAYWDRYTYVVWSPKTGAAEEWHSRLDVGHANTLNAAGQVGGQLLDGAFVGARGGDVQRLDGLRPGRPTDVVKLNDLGMATGHSHVAPKQPHAFFWSPDTGMVDLHPVGAAQSAGVDINLSGQIAGYVVSESGRRRAAVFDREAGTRELGCLPPRKNCTAEAMAINDRGQVVGNNNAYSKSRAFVWSAAAGLREIVATHGGRTYAQDINNAGQVVGRQWLSDDQEDTVPLYWDAENGTHELWSLVDPADPLRQGFTSFFPVAINHQGQILGDGVGPAGIGPVLLTPLR